MKVYTVMPRALKPYYKEELSLAADELKGKNFAQCWFHLERAHILGQPYPFEHTAVHWKMLRFGITIKSGKEVLGQLPRLFVGGIKSFVGKIPVGNTGGANVPPLRSMKIPADLERIISGTKSS
ncbi:MAG: DUF3703 domain-containing protein [Chitinophagaceae bacterium]|nr:MAG: DUF3703 domain-containing protein [Chitinophagaceae bacterium]